MRRQILGVRMWERWGRHVRGVWASLWRGTELEGGTVGGGGWTDGRWRRREREGRGCVCEGATRGASDETNLEWKKKARGVYVCVCVYVCAWACRVDRDWDTEGRRKGKDRLESKDRKRRC